MNILMILADQLRADCVGFSGNSVIKTPFLDRLAKQGVVFSQAYAQHPQCVPSRSSIFTGRYPHCNGSISNHTAMNPSETTMAEHFRNSGYDTYCIGKLHLFERKELEGFEYRMMCGGQQSDAVSPEVLREDYKNWLKSNGYWEAAEHAYAIHGTSEYWDNFRSNTNPIPYEAYIDTWVGDRAVEYIESVDSDRPFLMFVGFPNPHIPFDAPEPYASMYDPADMPVPETFHLGLEGKPCQHEFHKREGRREDFRRLSEPVLRRVMAYYYGSISLVDAQVGKILDALTRKGLDQDTVVVFVSDHGELLGHYGMLIKSVDKYPLMYDVGIHVPLVIRAPGCISGLIIDHLVELVDIYPTISEIVGLSENPWIQGKSQKQALYGGPAADREWIYSETGSVKALRGRQYKLVYYPGQPYGELYDILDDPHETTNLYCSEQHKDIRNQLINALLDREILTEAPLHGESKRGPAYWRMLHEMPYSY